MSHSVVTWAYKVEGLNGVSGAVLVYLAHCSNEDGTGARPSIKEICERTKCQHRAVNNAIAELISGGLIEAEPDVMPNGRIVGNKYRLKLERTAADRGGRS